MRRLIFLGAAAIGIVSLSSRWCSQDSPIRVGVHTGESGLTDPARRNPDIVSLPGGLGEGRLFVETGATMVLDETPVVAKESETDDPRELIAEKMAILVAELRLTSNQRQFIEEALMRRETEVAAWHAEIRASGFVNAWAHDRRAREIIAASQAQIISGLTPDQSRRFVDLLDSGRLPEGIAFEVTPGIVVVR